MGQDILTLTAAYLVLAALSKQGTEIIISESNNSFFYLDLCMILPNFEYKEQIMEKPKLKKLIHWQGFSNLGQ